MLAALAGCGTDSQTEPPAAAAPTAPALPACADVFAPGETIDQDQAAAGCLDPDGGTQFPGSLRCNDGRHLWSVDAATGAKVGWGFGGGKYRASKEVASDPAYAKAYETCNS